jgi:hypothetical protein
MTDFNEDQDTGLPVDLGPDDGNYDEHQEVVQEAESLSKGGKQDSDGDDLSHPMFEYETPDGKVLQVTGQQIVDLLERANAQQDDPRDAQIRELTERLKIFETVKPLVDQQAGRPGEQEAQRAGEPTPEQIEKFDEELGNRIVGMVEGEYGGPKALGGLFRNSIAQLVDMEVERKFTERSQREKVQTSFQSDHPDFDQTVRDPAFQKFMDSPRGYKLNAIEGYYAFKTQQLKSEMEALKTGAAKAKEEGVKEGEKQTIKNLKARGTLRSVGGGARASAFQRSGGKVNVSDEAALQGKMLEVLQQVRQQAG